MNKHKYMDKRSCMGSSHIRIRRCVHRQVSVLCAMIAFCARKIICKVVMMRLWIALARDIVTKINPMELIGARQVVIVHSMSAMALTIGLASSQKRELGFVRLLVLAK